jgi:hypothetical protein
VIDRLRGAGFLDRNKALGETHPSLYDVVFTLKRRDGSSSARWHAR